MTTRRRARHAVLKRIETSSDAMFATAMSGRPSRLKSPRVRAPGTRPATRSSLEVNVRPPWPACTLTPSAAMARSTFPSRFTSPVPTKSGRRVASNRLGGSGNFNARLFSKTLSMLAPKATVARSSSPSMSKSPAATDTGLVSPPTRARVEVLAKPPAPSPYSTVRVFELSFATATSRRPSRSKSEATMAVGTSPTSVVVAGARRSRPGFGGTSRCPGWTAESRPRGQGRRPGRSLRPRGRRGRRPPRGPWR